MRNPMRPTIMEIVPNIHRIEVPFGERVVCVYLLVGDERLLLVDSGLDSTPCEFILPYLEEIGCKDRCVDFVLTTHADIDHMGGNAALRELYPKACFMAHRLDRAWIEDVERIIKENYGQFDAEHGTKADPAVDDWFRSQTRTTAVDLELLGGERVHLGHDWWIEVRHTPGHTRGHLSVIDPLNNAAIIADAALFDALYTKSGRSAFPPTYRFVEDYLQTARDLLRLAPTVLLTSHYPVMRDDDVRSFLQATIDFTGRVEHELIMVLDAALQPLALSCIIELLHGRLGAWPSPGDSFLMYPLVGHLELLEQSGAVRKSSELGVSKYSRTGRRHIRTAS